MWLSTIISWALLNNCFMRKEIIIGKESVDVAVSILTQTDYFGSLG